MENRSRVILIAAVVSLAALASQGCANISLFSSRGCPDGRATQQRLDGLEQRVGQLERQLAANDNPGRAGVH